MSRRHAAALAAVAFSLVATACSTKPASDTVNDSATGAAAPTDTVTPAPAVATPAATTDTAAAATRTPSTAPSAGAAATAAPTGKGASPSMTTPAATTPADSTRKPKPAPAPAPKSTASTAAATKPAAAPAPSMASMAHPATSTAASTSVPAKASGTTDAASTSGGEATSAQSGSVKVNRFMSYDPTAKTVKLEVIAAFNSVQGGFNFNGGSNGSQTITVPAGWTVAMHVKNVDAIPHSAIIIADQKPLPNAPDSPAISRAYTSHVNDGLQAQTGSDDLNFRASKPGNYLIYCGVPGHGPSGMYIRFVVSESATTPSYSM